MALLRVLFVLAMLLVAACGPHRRRDPAWGGATPSGPASGAAYYAGQRVQVEWKGGWYPATIVQVNGAQYFVHYEGYDNSWDEWVGPERVREIATSPAPSPGARVFTVGERVSVQWKGSWYPAVVVQTNGSNYFVHYEGYDNSWDEWVGPDRVREIAPSPATNPPSDATYVVGQHVKVEWKGSWWAAEILQIANGKYFIHYDGYDNSWDEWVGAERIRAE